MAAESKLTPKIAKQLAWCFEHVMRRRKEELPGGLSITIYIDLAGRRHVMLARQGAVGPSQQEAATVLAHWPEPTPPASEVRWTPATLGRIKVLVSIWTLPEQAKQLELEQSRD